MSKTRTADLLLRLYPRAWRARYGEELATLVLEASEGRRIPWRVRIDVGLAGCRERLRAASLVGGGAPEDRVRGGALLVLCAWALFVLAGAWVQKFSEHWQDVTPAAGRALPATAFAGLLVAAVCASVLVLIGIAATTPSLAAFLRGGGWPALRRRVLTAALLTGLTAAGTVALVVWAHGLTRPERAGRDEAYAAAFVAWALLAVLCLLAWVRAAVATARQLHLPRATLRLEARIACSVSVAMGVMTAATVVWWAALAHAAPWFLAARPVGSSASPLAPQLLAAAALMLIATGLGAAGTRRALSALPALRSRP